MHLKPLPAALTVVVAGVGAGVARADAPPHELAGTPFYDQPFTLPVHIAGA